MSATCKSFRAQLLPEIFNTIRFTNNDISAASALIAVEAHGQYVKGIEFTCQCNLDDTPTAPSLLPAACRLLNGSLTPNLQTITLKYNFGLDNDYDDVYFHFWDEEDVIATRTEELQHEWRALMNETWEAVAANIFVRELVLDQLPPKWMSTYYTDAFRQFLGQLESATLNLFGFEDYIGYRTNSAPGTNSFLRNLDASFFRFMTGLKRLHIRASDPLGLEDYPPYIPLALKPEDLPLLQSLTLENCFICSELVLFIQSHAQILESLDVNECLCRYAPEYYSENLSWADFFDKIYEARPRLTQLIAGGSKAPFIREEYDEGTDDAVDHSLQQLEADSDLIAFRHMFLDTDYGSSCMDDEVDVERFHQGDDQRAYDRLMGLVKENRAGFDRKCI
ncbi:uncharacterized protein TrAtP1_002212 [Trichoderma atroviride]|uniref:uncharacterized protein n=1 Tax=Hypocrea atroviridis TaxID=63577 RepID=UPI0033214161|nr:hypothetical protein TrAtP1_002212 [Trichoderma atroviride]